MWTKIARRVALANLICGFFWFYVAPAHSVTEAIRSGAVLFFGASLAGLFGRDLTGKELLKWTEEIRQYGPPAYALVADDLRLDRSVPYREQNELIRELVAEAEACLALPRGEGRTRLHAVLLRAAPEGGAMVNSLLERIELVTMGELSWEDFVAESRLRIAELKKLNHLE